MPDDDHPRRRGMSTTERDLAGLAGRRDRNAPAEIDPELTPVSVMLTEIESAVSNRAASGAYRESDVDPYLRDVVHETIKVVARHTANVELASRANNGVDRIDALEVDVRALKSKVGFWQRVALAAAGFALSAVSAFVVFVYKRGVSEGSTEVRMQRIERDIERVDSRVQYIERSKRDRSFSTPSPGAPP